MGPGDRHDDEPAGERRDDPGEDFADEPAEPPREHRRAIPDPLDRVWVHPTELSRPVPRVGAAGRGGNPAIAARHRPVVWLAPLVAGAAGAVITVVALSVTGAFDASSASPGAALALRTTTSTVGPPALDALARLGPSVVAVVATDAHGTRRGSAVCIRHGAQLVTSARVVGGASTVQVVSGDGNRRSARVVGRDLVTDLALLDMPDDANVPAAQLAERRPSNGSSVWVLAAPAQGGKSGWTSSGTASSNDAMVVDKELGPTMLGLLETDAPSTSAAAGGALVDSSGKVAGIVLGHVGAHASSSTYAVSIDVAVGIAQQIDATGTAQHGSLGVRGVDTRFGPMIVAMSKGTPAARAGVRVRDLVMTVDGRSVTSIGEVTAVVRSLPPGRVVLMSLRRGGRPVHVRVQLGATGG